jgi:hypothetical protein
MENNASIKSRNKVQKNNKWQVKGQTWQRFFSTLPNVNQEASYGQCLVNNNGQKEKQKFGEFNFQDSEVSLLLGHSTYI